MGEAGTVAETSCNIPTDATSTLLKFVPGSIKARGVGEDET